jgi:hypothetical protein
MKNRLLFLLCCSLFRPYANYAQTVADTGLFIGFVPTQLTVQEIGLTLEKPRVRNSWGLLLAYRFPVKETAFMHTAQYWVGNDARYVTERYNGITLGVDRKYFIKDNRSDREFISIQALYRFWWHNNKFYANRHDGGSSPDDEYLTSSRDHVLALKGLYGWRKVSKGNARLGTFIDYTLGIGGRIQYKNEFGGYRQVWDDTRYVPPYKDYTKTKWSVWPTIHIGLTMGFVIRKKPD